MKPGDLRQFKDSKRARDLDPAREGRTFMVLGVDRRPGVDILIDNRVETDLGYFWVMDNSEAVDESR